MESILEKAIWSAENCKVAFCKFITPNDTGQTGGHQAGFHLHKNSWPLFFEKEGEKGSNRDLFVKIKWQDDFETDSRFIYYGVGTRNEYRLTRFGRGFPFLTDDNVGDLLVLSKIEDKFYEGFILQSESDIEEFLAALNISINDANGIIPKDNKPELGDQKLISCFEKFIATTDVDFPPTIKLAENARNCYNIAFGLTKTKIKSNPDLHLLNWIDAEFKLFKLFENNRYSNIIENKFESVEALIKTANSILNRRKSRAGKSLEHHLAELFNISDLVFDEQAITEGNKKPDFLFPNTNSYFDPKFQDDKLVVLAAKTTCKDRWRQILNEADRIKTKHLFTLQQGISSNQLTEMWKYDVQLVVPKSNIKTFPPDFRDKIMTLDNFIGFINNL